MIESMDYFMLHFTQILFSLWASFTMELRRKLPLPSRTYTLWKKTWKQKLKKTVSIKLNKTKLAGTSVRTDYRVRLYNCTPCIKEGYRDGETEQAKQHLRSSAKNVLSDVIFCCLCFLFSTPPSRTAAFEEFKQERGSEINRILIENKGKHAARMFTKVSMQPGCLQAFSARDFDCTCQNKVKHVARIKKG